MFPIKLNRLLVLIVLVAAQATFIAHDVEHLARDITHCNLCQGVSTGLATPPAASLEPLQQACGAVVAEHCASGSHRLPYFALRQPRAPPVRPAIDLVT